MKNSRKIKKYTHAEFRACVYFFAYQVVLLLQDLKKKLLI